MNITAQTSPMPKTPAQRVSDSQAKLIESGGRRIVVMAQPETVQAIDELVESEYAASASACISRAVVETAKRQRGKRK